MYPGWIFFECRYGVKVIGASLRLLVFCLFLEAQMNLLDLNLKHINNEELPIDKVKSFEKTERGSMQCSTMS